MVLRRMIEDTRLIVWAVLDPRGSEATDAAGAPTGLRSTQNTLTRDEVHTTASSYNELNGRAERDNHVGPVFEALCAPNRAQA